MRKACPYRKDARGFALVIVLAILVLLVILIVGFITRATTERAAASRFQASVITRALADTAVSVVQGQINLATTQGSSFAWASQPGMIRTFNNTNGNLTNAYKLYSAPTMISDQVSLDADLPTGDWAAQPALWTDLNAPVEVSGVKNYPILDPSSLGTTSAPSGFAVNAAPGTTTYQTAPMPVRWLYCLQDGSLVAPTDSSGDSVTVNGATKDNPIVGRVAFWTDDDTCKVNINTASEGMFWDTPRTFDPFDLNQLARFQPARHEFQRYAGHPATTSLSAVFPQLTASQIFNIVPRVSEGGSKNGTVAVDSASAVTTDSDRLYASADELLFDPDRNSNGLSKSQIEQAKFFISARSRAPETNLFNLPRVAAWPIYRLGANGTPDLNHTTAYDRLIAACSSSGVLGASSYYPYIFQRENSGSTTNDIGISRNIQLYNYLRYLTGTAFPGFGGNFSAKYGDDRDQILTEIFDYIRCTNLRDSSLPNLANAYTDGGNGQGWVAPTKYTSLGGSATMGFGRYHTISELGLAFICNAAPDDPATTTVDESAGSNIASGAGANVVLSGTPLSMGEKYIQAILIPEFFCPMEGFSGMNSNINVTVSGLTSLQINGQQLFPSEADGKTAYFGPVDGSEVLPYGGSATFRAFGLSKGAPARGPFAGDADPYTGSYSYPYIGNPIKISTTGGLMQLTQGATLTVSIYDGSGILSSEHLIQTLVVKIPAGSFPIPDIVSTATGDNNPVDVPRNWWKFGRGPTGTGGQLTDPGRLALIGNRVFGSGFAPYYSGAFFRPEFDTIRTAVPSHGDYRLLAASASVPDSVFVPQRYYNVTTRKMAASLSAPRGVSTDLPGNDIGGKYIAGATYNSLDVPDIPSDFAGTSTFDSPEATGDFDNGVANLPDGPYVNKADEGDISITNDTTGGTSWMVPYFRSIVNKNLRVAIGNTFFSPNRQIPSSAMFGSLSTGVKANKPWRTLLFRPQANHPNDQSHFSGSGKIQDHLLLDLFWMPVVEPYAISDRFSTAGKINMNYQVMPFTYIRRPTGLYAVLKSEKMSAIPTTDGPIYKGNIDPGNMPSHSYHFDIDIPATLAQFETKFDAGQIFKSASEICDLHMVPQGSTLADMQGTFWQVHALTGDNLRERIYATVYPRLTTKSNTYTVHFKAQALRKVSSTTPGGWQEGKDAILGEYRGSTSIERFVDANNPSIPDYAADPSSIPNLQPLDKFYRWRVIENRQFAP